MAGRRFGRSRRIVRQSAGILSRPTTTFSARASGGTSPAIAFACSQRAADPQAAAAGPERNRRGKSHAEGSLPETPNRKTGDTETHTASDPEGISQAVSIPIPNPEAKTQAVGLAEGLRQTFPKTLTQDSCRKIIGRGGRGYRLPKTKVVPR